MSKQDVIEVEGVVEALPGGGLYRVKLSNGKTVLCHLNGKMKQFKITVVIGDEVKVEVSPYDWSRGRISFRVRGR